MSVDKHTPKTVGPDADSNPRAPSDRPRLDATVLDEEPIAQQIDLVLRQRNAHRHGHVSRPATEIVDGKVAAIERPPTLHRAAATAAHDVDPLQWRERANQHCRGLTFSLGDDIDEAVNAVVQIHVRETGPSVERPIAPRRSWRGVARRVGFTNVCLDLDDRAARDRAALSMHEHLPEQIARDVERRSIVESARQFHFGGTPFEKSLVDSRQSLVKPGLPTGAFSITA